MKNVVKGKGARLWILCVLLLSSFAGCSSQPAEQPAEQPGPPVETTVKVMSLDEVHQRVAALQGKVVVVDLWATWCQLCVAEIPHLVQLQEKFPDRVHTLTLNVEYSGEDNSPDDLLINKVKQILQSNGRGGENILCSDPITTSLEKFETGLPAALVYDVDGNLVQTFDGTVDYEGEVASLITKLLK